MDPKGKTSTEITDDFRVTRARQVLDETTEGHGTYGECLGQLLALRGVVADLLNLVAEGTERDRVNVALLDALEAVNRSLDVKVAEAERLTRIEHDLRGVRRLLAGAVEAAKEQESR